MIFCHAHCSLDGEVEAALAAFDKAAQAASAEGGSAKGSVVATVELLRPAVCGVWHKTNEKWEGGPMSSLGGERAFTPAARTRHECLQACSLVTTVRQLGFLHMSCENHSARRAHPAAIPPTIRAN